MRRRNARNEIELHEKIVDIDGRCKSNSKRLDVLEERHNRSEDVLNNLDKSLSVTIEQIKNIAEDLKTTSINFKEAVTRSNNANAKETELLKEKYNELDRKIEKVSTRLEHETIGKDAEAYRESKKQIIHWIITVVLGMISMGLGISKFL